MSTNTINMMQQTLTVVEREMTEFLNKVVKKICVQYSLPEEDVLKMLGSSDNNITSTSAVDVTKKISKRGRPKQDKKEEKP